MKRWLISSGSTFEAEIGYSRAVVDGDWVFVSGTTGFDYRTMTIADGLPEQTEQSLRNIEAALAEAGSPFAALYGDTRLGGPRFGQYGAADLGAAEQPLVDRAIAALQKAGGMPQVFGFPTITDGIGMGTEAMKYSPESGARNSPLFSSKPAGTTHARLQRICAR